jgi:hypothetical protein
MPGKVCPTLLVLREIRDDIRELREINRATNERVDLLTLRVVRLEDGFVQLSTQVVAMGSTLVEVRDLLRDRLDQRDRIERLERTAGRHERRLSRLEKKH